jgi:cytochrome c peroxidase
MKYVMLIMLTFLMGLSSCSSDEDVYEEVTTGTTVTTETTTTENNNEIIAASLNLPITAFQYDVSLPNHFLANGTSQEDNTPNSNPITDNGATLGRVLFYDKQLSANNTISCASCHIQENGFSDPSRLSVGFDGGLTRRNSMGLANAKFYSRGRFFWDERAETLEDQVLMPIQDEVEMGLTIDEMVSKVSDDDYYKILFENAFGDDGITSNRIALALSQFVRSMVSYESKYDVGLAQTNNQNANFPNYTTSENLGKNLFFSNRTRCSECHDTNAFVADQPRNIGLDAVLTDLGVGGVVNNNNERGRFKVASLRNVELTAPYMHDGRFETLEEVVDFYDFQVQENENLDNRLRQGNRVRRLNLTNQEKQGLVDFLKTLTDDAFITDEKFSNPFIDQ